MIEYYFYVEISPSRKEIRLNSGVKSSTLIQNHKVSVARFLNGSHRT